jgi:hypothetical protein
MVAERGRPIYRTHVSERLIIYVYIYIYTHTKLDGPYHINQIVALLGTMNWQFLAEVAVA